MDEGQPTGHSMPESSEKSQSGPERAESVLLAPRQRVGDVEAERRLVCQVTAEYLAEAPRWAYSRQEAAQKLGVSVDFFEQHVAPDIRCVRRGRRRLFPAAELIYWLWRAAE
jgi:hypothetical protein